MVPRNFGPLRGPRLNLIPHLPWAFAVLTGLARLDVKWNKCFKCLKVSNYCMGTLRSLPCLEVLTVDAEVAAAVAGMTMARVPKCARCALPVMLMSQYFG